jgi:peptidyl-prolyl cis-trans isomerase D
MLEVIRRHAGSWMVKTLFILIAFVFSFWGVEGYRERAQNTLAKVNGERITILEFRNSYDNIIKMLQEKYKGNFSDKLIKKLKLKERVINDLIERSLILNIANNLKIKVSDEDIRNYIANNPMFQYNGFFNKNLYIRILKDNRIAPAEYERAKRIEILISKVVNIIKDSTKVSDAELYDIYRLNNEKINLRFIKISPSLFMSKVKLDDKKIKEYYMKNKESFRMPEMAKIRYILFDPDRFIKDVPVSKEEMESYYNINIDRFKVPKMIRAKHILIKVGKDDNPQKVKHAKDKMKKILERLKKGEDFDKLARKYSEDAATAKKGGDLGYFKKGDMIRPFESEAFKLKKGEISGIIRTNSGFHIIKVEDIKKGKVKSLKEVSSDIEREIKKEKSKDYTEELARRCFNKIYKSKDIEKCAIPGKTIINESEYFSYGGDINGIRDKGSIAKIAFTLKKNSISGIMETKDGFFIVKLLDKKKARVPSLKEIRNRIITSYLNMESLKIAEQEARKSLELLKSGKTNLTEIAKKYDIKIEETGLFSRSNGYIPNIGISSAIENEVFSLKKGNKYPSNIFKVGGYFYLVEVYQKISENKDRFSLEKDKLKKEFYNLRKEEIFRQWIEWVKSNANIEVKKEALANL